MCGEKPNSGAAAEHRFRNAGQRECLQEMPVCPKRRAQNQFRLPKKEKMYNMMKIEEKKRIHKNKNNIVK